MSITAISVLLFGALAGGFVSGLAGFGTALMALGIWLYVVTPDVAVQLVLICSIIAQTWTMPSIWRSIDFKLVWPFLVGGLAGVPLGTLLIAYADPHHFKLGIGILLLVFPAALYFSALTRGLERRRESSADTASDLPAACSAAVAGLSVPVPILWASVAAGGSMSGAASSDFRLDDLTAALVAQAGSGLITARDDVARSAGHAGDDRRRVARCAHLSRAQ